MAGETEPFFVKARSSTLISSSFPSERSIDMIESRECTASPGSIGEDQEATSMGDLLSDIFSSHFPQASLAANSPQDLFGILDLLETPQETSKFMSLIEDSGHTCNNNNNNGNSREDEESHLKLPILEQEPEMEPTTDNNICTTLVEHHGSSKTTHMQSSQSNSGAASDLFKDALHTFVRESNKCQLKSSETCDALLQKSWSFQSNLPEDFSESETDYMLEKGQHKRLKVFPTSSSSTDQVDGDGQRMTHIAVERNRRKQMNEHLAVLRSLMPGFYVQRGDQASIIGGVIEFIKELQQLLQSLESKKQRKAYAEVLSPRPMQCGTGGATPISTPTPSPRASLPISPRTPQSAPTPCTSTHSHPHRAKNKSMPMSIQLHPTSASSFMDPSFETVKELVANSKSAVADVEVKIAGSNALLKTLSHRIPGQMLKLVQTLEGLSLEILHLNISTIDDTVLNSFTLKIGIECKLSVDELAQAVQQTFSC